MNRLIDIFVLAGVIIPVLSQGSDFSYNIQKQLAVPYDTVLNSIQCDLNVTGLDVSKLGIIVDYKDMSKKFGMSDFQEIISLFKGIPEDIQIMVWFVGFNEYYNSPESQLLMNVMKKKYFLIFIDTSAYTTSTYGNFLVDFPNAVKFLPSIAKVVAKFYLDLVSGGIESSIINFFAQSLSCATVGQIAQYVKSMSNGTEIMQCVWCADHVGVCFEAAPLEFVLDSSDAVKVWIMHGNRGELGIRDIPGTANFRADGEGVHAKQCRKYSANGLVLPVLSSCSHFSPVSFWMTAINNNSAFPCTRCPTYNEFAAGKCAGNHQTFVGPATSGDARGLYYFNTSDFELEYAISDGILDSFVSNFVGQPFQ